ncbi:MAG: endonuclease/exonuclease/phosphatase family protein [Deltaproteobacteria bacterium]|nr:endonuclease/exonuclease/phosphatase family protein [Deltaproteobacteria bacterium]
MRVNLFRGAFVSVILLATICLGCFHQLGSESLGYITVLTYNTHLFEGSRAAIPGVPVSFFKEGKFFIFDDNKRQKQIEKNIRKCGADIVALQEVWADHRQERLWKNLKNVYPYHFVAPQSENIKDLLKTGYKNTCGLVLLSKYKFIGQPKFFEFDRSRFTKILDPERLARKGVITATVELRPGGPTIRLGISQTASGNDMEMIDSEKVAEETVRGERGGRPIDSPAIMMGDFNVHARWEGQFDRLKEKFAKYDAVDAYREVHPCDSEERMSEDDYTIDRQKNELIQKFFKPSKDPRIDRDRIDYVFVKKSGGGLELKPVEAEVIHDWKYKHTRKKLFDLSDHYPVKVKFMVTHTTTP